MKIYIIQLSLVQKQIGISGLNATRALTTKFNAQLNCGRVQTPTVAMIAAVKMKLNISKPKHTMVSKHKQLTV